MTTEVWVLFIAIFVSGDGESFRRSTVAMQDVYLSEAGCQADGQAWVADYGTTSEPGSYSFAVESCMRTELHGDPTGD